MSLRLIASKYVEGECIVRDLSVGTVALLRPPYKAAARTFLTENDVKEAVSKHGFHVEDREFTTYSALIAEVERSVGQMRQSIGIPLPAEIPLKNLVGRAPANVVTGFLDRIERELLPRRNWDQAEKLLLDILETREEANLKSRAGTLLRQIRSAMNSSQKSWTPTDIRFSHVDLKLANSISLAIRRQRSILVPSS